MNVDDPTVLDARAVYQFGAGVDRRSRPLTIPEYRRAHGTERGFTCANGLSTSSTVGQWRATVIAKLGSATANQSVLAQ